MALRQEDTGIGGNVTSAGTVFQGRPAALHAPQAGFPADPDGSSTLQYLTAILPACLHVVEFFLSSRTGFFILAI